MNPLRLFDYVFYSIASLYGNKFGYEESKTFAGVLFLSIIQLSNCTVIISFFSLLKTPNYDPVFNYIGNLFILLILNFVRYYKFSKYENLELKWDNDSNRIKLVKISLVILYVIISIVLLGSINKLQ